MCNPIYYAWVGTYWWYCFSYHIIIDCPSSSLLFQINKCTIFTYLFWFNFNKKIRSVHSRGEMAFSISTCGQPVNPLVHGKDSYQVPRVQIQFMLFVPFFYLLFERTVLYYASIQLVYRRHRYRITQAQSLAGLSRQNDSLSSAASTQYFRSEFNRGVGPCHQDHF